MTTDRQTETEASEGTSESLCSIPAICAAWLTENGYDGLCDPTIKCGCSVIDLMPCDSPGLNTCVPAHKEMQDDGDWLMFPDKSNISIREIEEQANDQVECQEGSAAE